MRKARLPFRHPSRTRSKWRIFGKRLRRGGVRRQRQSASCTYADVVSPFMMEVIPVSGGLFTTSSSIPSSPPSLSAGWIGRDLKRRRGNSQTTSFTAAVSMSWGSFYWNGGYLCRPLLWQPASPFYAQSWTDGYRSSPFWLVNDNAVPPSFLHGLCVRLCTGGSRRNQRASCGGRYWVFSRLRRDRVGVQGVQPTDAIA